jgi:hypothetical protein
MILQGGMRDDQPLDPHPPVLLRGAAISAWAPGAAGLAPDALLHKGEAEAVAEWGGPVAARHLRALADARAGWTLKRRERSSRACPIGRLGIVGDR